MSAAAACGGGGMDGDDDKKRKRPMAEDAPDLPSESSDASNTDSDDESAPTDQKPKGLSPHCPGKSKSFSDLTKLGDTRTEEIAKKEHKVDKKRRIEMHREVQEALTKLEETIGRVAAARIGLREAERMAESLDQPMAEGNQEEEVSSSDEDKKATEEEDDAEKSKADMIHDSKTDEENGGKK